MYIIPAIIDYFGQDIFSLPIESTTHIPLWVGDYNGVYYAYMDVTSFVSDTYFRATPTVIIIFRNISAMFVFMGFEFLGAVILNANRIIFPISILLRS